MRSQKATSLSTSFLQSMKILWAVFNITIISLLLSSCIFSDNKAPAYDLSGKRTVKGVNRSHHKVVSGETLFAIAWRYGVDYKDLARINSIGKNYLIYPGQSLVLLAQPKNILAHKSSSTASSRSQANTSSRAVTSKTSSSERSVSRVSTPKQSKAVVSVPRPEKKSSQKNAVATSKYSSEKLRWQWPTKGRVITNYSSGNTKNKGIDLLGKKGDSVFAAATGTVVYAGSGLRAYGKLIIIKHNDTYLSAYAHNDRIRVKEGQKVKAGQHIADIGSSGSRTESVKLHFEIRRNGQPINPLIILPKRKT